MEKKQRFFIYDRKEVGVLLLLGVMVAAFAFTLGVHLGKRVTARSSVAPTAAHSESVAPVAEASSRAELEQAMSQPTSVPPAAVAEAQDAASQATQDEVKRTGVQLEDRRQLELPKETKTKTSGATAGVEQKSETAAPVARAETPTETAGEEPAAPVATSSGSARFTLQVGSYSNYKEAQDRVKDLEVSGLTPRVHATDIKGKGRWYRIYLGGFPTKAAAEKAGEKYRAQGVIGSFIVAKSPI